MSQLLKKITTATCGLSSDKLIRTAMPPEGKPAQDIPVLRVWGIAAHLEEKLSDKGPYTLLHGMFEATNLLDGEMFKSGSCIIPGPAGSFLIGKLRAAGENGEAPFVCEIGVKYDPSAVSKYVFTGKLLGEDQMGGVDPLEKFRAIAMQPAQKAVAGAKK